MQLDTEIEISVLSCFYLSKRRQMQLHFQPICTGRGLFLPFKKKADATENGEERVAKSCFYLSKRRQMQLIFSKRLISNLFSLFFRLYFLTFYLLKS